MKKTFYLVLVLVLVLAPRVPAATVIFQFQTPFGQASTPAISLTPLSVPVQQIGQDVRVQLPSLPSQG
jgi:hypothetical protein